MMNKKQTVSIVVLLMVCVGLLLALFLKGRELNDNGNIENKKTAENTKGQTGTDKDRISVIESKGNTLETRILVPEGYKRTKVKNNSLTAFLRSYELKKAGSPVRYYNGKKKANQNVHAAVFCLPLEKADLQQCADSIMRVYAEYYWSTQQYDKIAFHFVSGFLAEYSKWRQGYRILVHGDDVSWTKSAEADSSYKAFQEYMQIVFSYASTLSMEAESKKIEVSAIRTGDILIKGGSPGHVVMVVDVCRKENGKKAFLLAQGFMPAQEFHLLKNPLHEEDPWYYEEEVTWPLSTPEYTFDKGDLMRPGY